jgi:hypothetical protein
MGLQTDDGLLEANSIKNALLLEVAVPVIPTDAQLKEAQPEPATTAVVEQTNATSN